MLKTVLTFFALLVCVFADEGKTYKEGEKVKFYVNTIGPYSNPSEVYRYYSLPLCAPPKSERQTHRGFKLGEQLEGDRISHALYELNFKVNEEKILCKRTFHQQEKDQLRLAIEQYYYFELFCDDLPIHGFIGHKEGDNYYLFSHVQFNILHNDKQVISVNVSSAVHKLVELRNDGEDQTVEFTYSVKWTPTTIPYERRHYLSTSFFKSEMEIHWLSIVNSFVLVLLLSGFLAIIILRILKSDYTRYNSEDPDEEDYGW
eukprot:CAMPEP_0174256802 /NCGR_PEP_ID=MMETSP0439-20130205/5994_1 /TAXON_ID=0 /ORGANISM="Stereomyxa ramosa, Strain Chinc5" /LENGTH=258 /DNA_ID=CAMNT_0015339575 /DNA_START=55 /DNA_END=828 /DNA_ORIENTATION=+